MTIKTAFPLFAILGHVFRFVNGFAGSPNTPEVWSMMTKSALATP
jgi:hypothetical protein